MASDADKAMFSKLQKQLKAKGVTLLKTLVLQCETCNQVWSPNLLPDGGELPKGYWQCPNGCNAR